MSHSAAHSIPTEASDEVMACAELAQDPLFHKIPPDRIPYYVRASLEAGRAAAAAYAGRSVRDICGREGLRYEISKRSGKFHNVSFRAQIDFAKPSPEVIIYASSLAEMEQACRAVMGEANSPERERLIDIHLAHELYHYLEYKSGNFTNERLEPITVFRIGPFAKTSTVVKCSEIAAHAFCKEIIGLPFLPNLLDYMYLIHTGAWTWPEWERQTGVWKTWM
ncbi:hypothetical protein V3851_20460 [Paenibacillus sp. M1]|uniref:Uncharacterized protein n=1 Tax=Paenibacillus haidiansis TaxID=1574488 RepID=A0ABU7VY47_9BACL